MQAKHIARCKSGEGDSQCQSEATSRSMSIPTRLSFQGRQSASRHRRCLDPQSAQGAIVVRGSSVRVDGWRQHKLLSAHRHLQSITQRCSVVWLRAGRPDEPCQRPMTSPARERASRGIVAVHARHKASISALSGDADAPLVEDVLAPAWVRKACERRSRTGGTSRRLEQSARSGRGKKGAAQIGQSVDRAELHR